MCFEKIAPFVTNCLSWLKPNIRQTEVDLVLSGQPFRDYYHSRDGLLPYTEWRGRYPLLVSPVINGLQQRQPNRPLFHVVESGPLFKSTQDKMNRSLGVKELVLDSKDFSPCIRKRNYFVNVSVRSVCCCGCDCVYNQSICFVLLQQGNAFTVLTLVPDTLPSSFYTSSLLVTPIPKAQERYRQWIPAWKTIGTRSGPSPTKADSGRRRRLCRLWNPGGKWSHTGTNKSVPPKNTFKPN